METSSKSNENALLTDIGEYQIHALLEGILNDDGVRNIGDDCAVLDISDENALLINVDRLPNGIEPYMRARLCVAQTLSDIICMGGRPSSYLMALTLPRDTSLASLQDLMLGVKTDLASYGARLIGGDTKEGAAFHMVGIGIGTVPKKYMVRRLGAEPGMVIGVTSAAKNLWGPRWAHALIETFSLKVPQSIVEACKAADYMLILPFAESLAITSTGRAKAGLDLSDGVGGGLKILARASQVGIDVRRAALRGLVDPTLGPVAQALNLPLESLALSPSYSWENMYAVHKDDVDLVTKATEAAGGAFTIIGDVTEEPGIRFDGVEIDATRLPDNEKFAHDYTWEERFEAWRSSCRAILGGY
jgi:thiamine-monophosphate kinase